MKPDQIAQNKAEELRQLQENQKHINLAHKTFGTPEGKLYLAFLKQHHDFNGLVFTRQKRGDFTAFDPLNAALKDGGRAVIITIETHLAQPYNGEANMKPKGKVLK